MYDDSKIPKELMELISLLQKGDRRQKELSDWLLQLYIDKQVADQKGLSDYRPPEIPPITFTMDTKK